MATGGLNLTKWWKTMSLFNPYVVSVYDVYNDAEPKIPVGFKAVTFRPPKQGERYLHTNGCTVEVAEYGRSGPRLILTPNRLVFEFTGEERPPSAGEYFLSHDSYGVVRATTPHTFPKLILRKVEE